MNWLIVTSAWEAIFPETAFVSALKYVNFMYKLVNQNKIQRRPYRHRFSNVLPGPSPMRYNVAKSARAATEVRLAQRGSGRE